MAHGVIDTNLELYAKPKERKNMLRVSENLLPYRAPRTPDYYNHFFCPNLCHVCKKEDNGNMITCDQCYMILYCDIEHKMLHYPEHMEFCEAIKRHLGKDAQWRSRRFNRDEWIQSRKIFLHSVQQQIPCELKPYEQQMILFAKSCLICHQQANLQTCRRCYSHNYCVDHAAEFAYRHKEKCENLMICVNLDIGYFDNNSIMQSFISTLNEEIHDENIFINHFGDFATLFKLDVCFHTKEWLFDDYIYSDFLSGVLSLFHAMEEAEIIECNRGEYDLRCNYIHDANNTNDADIWHIFDNNINDADIYDNNANDDYEMTEAMKDTLVFHVITGTNVDKQYLPTWEIFIHMMRSLSHIIIVLIGPDIANERNNIETCILCKKYGNTISYEGHCTLYHNYVNSEFYKRPDIIIGFQAELYHESIGPKFLMAVYNQCCPLVLTTTSVYKMEQNKRKIHEYLSSEVVELSGKYILNKFSSHRPWRDFETDNVYYRNSYIMVYRHLNNSIF
ncbi:PREDICTED: uncharacterized protein LOC106744173 [Dinoponera quadriceps]|uniref:Uncharacterized protein LOC106744173 n=1 Tax=Dinoponera quadriceps TaxID=609295 RepID=A0A6P3X7D2_DINQU|nr:PREDICTED: uncharacterized protein LOC106744173 [Dinoponera quadriceps]